MSKSKHYILSFTTLFYNEKGYVLMFNRHQNVAHLDSFPVAFDPWNRYSALIMRDMKVGTKVKRKTDLIKSVGADFRTIWESDDPTTLQQGSLYYLSNVSELLNKGEKDPIYGDSVDKYKKVNPFYNRVDEIIKDVNGMVVKGAEGVDNLPFVDLKQHSDNHANLDQSYSTSLGTLSKSELFNKLLVTNEGSTIDMLETMTLLNEDGYNQAIELANVVFKGGLTTGSMERLLAIQYGEKVLDIAKANYVKSALGMLLDKVSDSHMLSMQGNRTDDETAKVLIGSEGYKSKLDQSTLDRRDGVVDKFEVLVKIPDIHYVQHAEGISTIKNVKQSDFLPQVNLGHVAMLSFLPNSVNGSKRFWLESTVTGLDDSGSNVISHGDISNDIYTTLFKESSIEGMSFSKNIKSSEIMKSPSNITRTYEMITDTDTASADITHIGQSQLEGQDQATVYNLTYASGVSLESVKHVSKECDLSTSNRAVAVTLGNKDKLDLFEIYTWVEGTEEGIEVAGIDHVVYGDLITIDNIKLLNIFSAIYDEISISNLYSKEGVSLDLSLVQYYRSNDANILNTETAQLISDSEGDMTYYNFAENPEGHVLDILVDNSDTAVLLNEHECNILNDRLSLAGINDIVDLAVIEESIVDKVSLIFDTDRDPISLGRKSNMDFDADVEDEVSVYIPEKEYNTDIIQSSLTHIRETEYATEVGLGTRATVHEAIYDLSHDKGISAKVEEDIYETDMQESTNSVKYDKPYDIALTHTDSSRKIEVDYDVDVQLSELFNMVQEELEVSLEGIRNNRKVVSEVETLLESLEAVQINEIAYTVDVTVPDRSFMNSVYDVVVHLVEDADLQDIDIEVKLASWDEAKSEGTYNLVLNASELALDGNVYQDITLHQIDEPTTSTSYDVTLLETMESDGLTKTPDVLLHTLAEVEIESATDTELQTSIKAETTRTTDLVLETMDESSTSSNTDVIVESTQKGSINSASEVVIEWGAESAVDGNMLRDITLDWTNKSTTSTSYDVMLLDIIESEVESNTDIELQTITKAEVENNTDIELQTITKAEVENNTDLELQTITKAEVESNTDIELQTITKAEVESNTDIELQTITKAEVESNTDIELQTITKAEVESNTDIELQTIAKAEAENNTDIELQTITKAEVESNTDIELQTITKAEVESNTDIELQTITKAEVESNTDIELQTITKAEVESNTDIELQTIAKAEVENNTDIELQTITKAEVENNTDIELQTITTAETTSTTDLVLETMDESSTSSKTDVIVENTQKGSINSASEVVIEWDIESNIYSDKEVTLDIPEYAFNDNNETVEFVSIDTGESTSNIDINVEDIDLAEIIRDDEVSIEDTNTALVAQEYEVELEEETKGITSTTVDMEIEDLIDGEPSNTFEEVILDDFDDAQREISKLMELLDEETSDVTGNSNQLIIEDEELVNKGESTSIIEIEEDEDSDKGRSKPLTIDDNDEGEKIVGRELTIDEEDASERGGEKIVEIYDEDTATVSGSTIMEIEEEKVSERRTDIEITIDNESESDRIATTIIKIEGENETDIISTQIISIDDEDQGIKTNLFTINISNEDHGYSNGRDFKATFDEDDAGIRIKEDLIEIGDIRNEEDEGVGLPPVQPPWEEEMNKGKIWLMMGKNYPAWNGWNNKKTR